MPCIVIPAPQFTGLTEAEVMAALSNPNPGNPIAVEVARLIEGYTEIFRVAFDQPGDFNRYRVSGVGVAQRGHDFGFRQAGELRSRYDDARHAFLLVMSCVMQPCSRRGWGLARATGCGSALALFGRDRESDRKSVV